MHIKYGNVENVQELFDEMPGMWSMEHYDFQVVGSLYMHLHKCVIVDSQGPGNNRKLTVFVGGLDLCDGRYDTPEHRLFHDLQTPIFNEDYHNPTFPTKVDASGPKKPWHDLHCKIDGPVAYDVLTNFEQRWHRTTRWHEFGQRFRKVHKWHDDALIKINHISWILSPKQDVPDGDPHLWVIEEDDPDSWHVQVFRSIDSGSVKGFPKNTKEAEEKKKNLICKKNIVIDKSIHTAYVKAIRSAQHFIYIENQYFFWDHHTTGPNTETQVLKI